MKLFQKLLVTPTALGIMTPLAISAAISNVPDKDDSHIQTARDEDETQYEFSYAYPVNDYITITPGLFFIEGDSYDNRGDTTGMAINTSSVF